jgi:RNA-directed DNA polymerase
VLVRYADDFLVLCRSVEQVKEAERRIGIILERLKLQLHPEKTRTVDLSRGKEGFDFLGCHLRKCLSGRILKEGKKKYFLQRWPSTRSMKRVRAKIHEQTSRRRSGVRDVRQLIAGVNPVLRGWGNYFRTGNATQKFQAIDWYTEQRIRKFLECRSQRPPKAKVRARWTGKWLHEQGLRNLSTITRQLVREFREPF